MKTSSDNPWLKHYKLVHLPIATIAAIGAAVMVFSDEPVANSSKHVAVGSVADMSSLSMGELAGEDDDWDRPAQPRVLISNNQLPASLRLPVDQLVAPKQVELHRRWVNAQPAARAGKPVTGTISPAKVGERTELSRRLPTVNLAMMYPTVADVAEMGVLAMAPVGHTLSKADLARKTALIDRLAGRLAKPVASKRRASNSKRKAATKVASRKRIVRKRAVKRSSNAIAPLLSADLNRAALKKNVAKFLSKYYRRPPGKVGTYVKYAYEAGRELGVDPLLISAIMSIESSLNPRARSHKGAKGLMQVLVAVHTRKFRRFGGVSKAYHPRVSVMVGTTILSKMLNRTRTVQGALKHYVGAANLRSDGGYGAKVIRMRDRIWHASQGLPVPRKVNLRKAIKRANLAQLAATDFAARADAGDLARRKVTR